MNKTLIVLLAAVIFFSGCIGEKTVKKGDTISVNYTGSLQDGTVFDTSIESIAKEYDIIKPEYVPLKFKVGEPGMIEGFNEGVVGMKAGEKKTIIIPPEKGYGHVRPELIGAYGIIENISAKDIFPKVFDMPLEQFESIFGPGHNKSDTVLYPGTNINLTIQNITDKVSLAYNFSVESQILLQNEPWNYTVVKIDAKNITVKSNAKINDTIRFRFDQFQKMPFTSTVIGVTDDNITIRHNAIPETKIQTIYGTMMTVKFNDTSFMLDQNHELAGKTLIFNVTLIAIDTGTAQ